MARNATACRTAAVTLILWHVVTRTGLAADLPDLETIRAAYVESTAAIRTIQYDLELRWERTKDFPAAMNRLGGDSVVLTQAHVVQDGVRVARQTEYVTESEAHRLRSWASYDGTLYSSWWHSVQAPPGREQLPEGQISASHSPRDDATEISLRTLLGTLVVPDQSIEKFLIQPETQVVGWDELEGVRCVKVEMAPYAPYRRKPDVRLQVIGWFDPLHGYLPRRLRMTNPVPAKGEKPMMTWEVSVSRFQKLKADATHRRWVPVIGIRNMGVSLHRIRLSEIQINPPISDDQFQPEFPFGTQVLDQRRGKPAERYFAGGEEGAKHYTELMQAHVAARDKEKSEFNPDSATAPDED